MPARIPSLALLLTGCVAVVDLAAPPVLDLPARPADGLRPVAGCTATARWFLDEDGLTGEAEPGRGLSSVTVERWDTRQRLFSRTQDGVRAPWPAYESDRALLATWIFEDAPAWPESPDLRAARTWRGCGTVDPTGGVDRVVAAFGGLGHCENDAQWSLAERDATGQLLREDAWVGGPEPLGAVSRTVWDPQGRVQVEGTDQDADGVVDAGLQWAWTVVGPGDPRVEAAVARDLADASTIVQERERSTAADGSERVERHWEGARASLWEEVTQRFAGGHLVESDHTFATGDGYTLRRTWAGDRLVAEETEHRGASSTDIERWELTFPADATSRWLQGTRSGDGPQRWTHELVTIAVPARDVDTPRWPIRDPTPGLTGPLEVVGVDERGLVRSVVRADVVDGEPTEATWAWLPQHDVYGRRAGTVLWAREPAGGGWLEGWLAVEEVTWACPTTLPPP